MKKIKQYLLLVPLVLSFAVLGFASKPAEAVTYTAAEVAAHSTASDCWVIVNDNVYNLTSFIPLHPGGQGTIIASCGKDGTSSFNAGPHPAGTLNSINSYMIGTLGASTPNPVLTSLTVTPTAPSIAVGGTSQLSAATKDQGGNAIAATLTFSSGNTAIATVNSSTGLVTGVSAGTATITTTAVSGSVTLSASTVVTVTNVAPTPVLTSVAIAPKSFSVSAGGTYDLNASPKDQNGMAFSGATSTFTSSNTAIATVNSSTGLVTGVSAGTATITVTSVSGNITVTDTSSVTVSAVVSGGGDDSDYDDDSDEGMENDHEDHYSDHHNQGDSEHGDRHEKNKSNRGDESRSNHDRNDGEDD